MNDYTRYDQLYDSVLLKLLEETYAKSYSEGWFVTDLMRDKNGNWIVKWDRDIINNPVSDASK